jgi:hypothetical protein
MMKVKYLVLTSILLFPLILNAQLISELGILGGYTSSNINVDQFDDFSKRRSGFTVGVFSDVLNNPIFSIAVQIQYTQKGFIMENIETDEQGNYIQTAEANFRLHYISMPIMAKIKYSTAVISPYLLGGPRLDYLIGRKNGVFKALFTNVSYESNFANNFSNFVFGGTVGAGIKLPPISKLNLAFEFAYNFDFTDSSSKIETLEAKNNSYDILVKIGL